MRDSSNKKNLEHLRLSGCLNKIEVGLNKAKFVGLREMHGDAFGCLIFINQVDKIRTWSVNMSRLRHG